MNINNWFNPDNMLFRFMGRISDLMMLNFLWIICSLPVITIGASTTALYNMTLKLVDENEGYIAKEFFKSFRDNFKRSTIVWIGMLLIFSVITVNILFWLQFKSIAGCIAESIIIFLGLVFVFVDLYAFPILSSFNKGALNAVKKACVLSLRYLPCSIAVLFITILAAGILAVFPFTVLFMIFVGFAFIAYMKSYLFKYVFGKCLVYLQES